jgi:hypothetical protein
VDSRRKLAFIINRKQERNLNILLEKKYFYDFMTPKNNNFPTQKKYIIILITILNGVIYEQRPTK